jgi:hypothetical protein
MSKASDIGKDHVASIVEKVRSKGGDVAKGADKFLQGDVFKALLIRHKYLAIDAIVLNELHNFDPTIADASCEMRPPLFFVLHDMLRAILKPEDPALAAAHRTSHANDKADTQVKTVDDALGAPPDPAYTAMVERIESAIDERWMNTLILSSLFTESSVWSRDEFGFMYSFRSKAVMAVAGEEAIASGNPKDQLNLESLFRSSLATDAVALFKEMFGHVPRHEAVADNGNAPKQFTEDQLSVALDHLKSQITYVFKYSGNSEQEDIPVLPIFNQIYAILLILYHQGRGIALRVRCTELTPLPSSGGSTKQRFSERHVGTYISVFKPNPETGLFNAVHIADQDQSENYFAVDCFNKRIVGTAGKGLDAADVTEHKAALEASNIAWLLLQYAAAHPAYAAAVKKTDINYDDAYDAICTRQPEDLVASFTPTREHFPEFTLKPNRPGESRPNLANLWKLARENGEKRDLHDNCQIVLGPLKLDLYERINRAIDWQPDHMYPASLQWLVNDTKASVDKHNANPEAVFGPFIVRLGASACSCSTIEDANRILDKKKTAQRWALYKTMYPANAGFAN